MICPKCNNKLQVKDVVNNKDEGEVYRKLKCNICDKIYYSCENFIDYRCIKKEYNDYGRKNLEKTKKSLQ